MNNLAETYRAQGRTGDAARLHEEVLEKSRRILGDDHPDTLTTMNNLAETYRAQGRTGDAAKLHEEVLEKQADPGGRSSQHAHDHEQPRGDIPGSGEDGGRGRASGGGAGEARRILGDDHPDTLTTMNNLAATYGLRVGRGTRPVYRGGAGSQGRILGDDHPAHSRA